MKIDITGRAFAPVELENHEIFAIRNIARGEASPDQQKKAFQLIVERFCSADDLSYRPDELGGQRDTDFHEGRRFPGLQLRKIAFAPADRVLNPETTPKENPKWRTNRPTEQPQQQTANLSSSPVKRKGGWPKGKKRGPRKPRSTP
jgi:hypothetical protein